MCVYVVDVAADVVVVVVVAACDAVVVVAIALATTAGVATGVALLFFAVASALVVDDINASPTNDCATDDDVGASCIVFLVAHVDAFAAAITTHAASIAVGYVI